MDILDTLKTPQSQKHSKNKTSILSSIPQSFAPHAQPYGRTSNFKNQLSITNNNRSSQNSNSNINSQQMQHLPARNSIQHHAYKPSIFINRDKNQHASYQHLKEVHFDCNTLSAIGSNIGSHQDAASDNGNKVVRIMTAGNQSLGVIESENSQSSKQTHHPSHPPRSRTSKPATTLNSVPGGVSLHPSSESHNLQKTRLRSTELQNKIKELEAVIKSKDEQLSQKNKQIQEKQKCIQELKIRIQQQKIRMCQEKEEALGEIKKNMEICYLGVVACHRDQSSKKEEILKWEASKKEQLLNQQIEKLKTTIAHYQSVLESQSQLLKQINLKSLTVSYSQTQPDPKKCVPPPVPEYKNSSQLCQECEYIKQKLQHLQIQTNNFQKSMQEQNYKMKREKIQMEGQIRKKWEEGDRERERKERELQKLERELLEGKWMLEAERHNFEKEKQNMKQIYQKWNREHKTALQEMSKQRDRVFQLEKQLLSKIQIVQMYNQNRPTPPPKIPTPHSQIATESDPKKENNQKQNSSTQNKSLVKQMGSGVKNSRINVKGYLNQISQACNPATKAARKGRSIYRLLEFYT